MRYVEADARESAAVNHPPPRLVMTAVMPRQWLTSRRAPPPREQTSIAAPRNCGHEPVLCERECRESRVRGSSILARNGECVESNTYTSGNITVTLDAHDERQYEGCVDLRRPPAEARGLFGRVRTKRRAGVPPTGEAAERRQHYAFAWRAFMRARGDGKLGASVPGARTMREDFVLMDARIAPERVRNVKRRIASFTAGMREAFGAGPAAEGTEAGPSASRAAVVGRGAGVVIVGGSGKYRTPFWVALHALRRAGSTLPVEIWFPAGELPSCLDKGILERLGATTRSFGEFNRDVKITNRNTRVNNVARRISLSRFMFKAFALMFSAFEEILLLDADNVVVQDPRFLFSSGPYAEHGAVFWQDFWRQTAAPDAHEILGNSTRMRHTHESGQMVVHKGRHWDALWLNLFMNSFSGFFYPLTVNYMGLGDKELLPFAIASAGGAYALVRHGPDHVGVRVGHRIFGNTMLQFSPAGEPLFLHANLGKWTTDVPTDRANWVRRWQASALRGDGIVDAIAAHAGADLELWIYELLLREHCLFKPRRQGDEWLANIGVGPFLEGMYLDDHPNPNTDLAIFTQEQCFRPAAGAAAAGAEG